MTQLFEQAVSRVSQLSNDTQNEIASIIIQELEDEVRWEKSFAQSQDKLSLLAKEALAEYRSGKTEP
jgi:hypothetical protein